MPKKGFSLLAITSLSALCKVCSSSSISSKSLTFLRNLSTAAQSSDFLSSNEHNSDFSNESYQNPAGFHGSTQYSFDFNRNPTENGLNPNENFRENGHRNEISKYPFGHNGDFCGFRDQNHGDLEHNWNSQNVGGDYWENQKNPVELNGNVSGYYGNNMEQFQQNFNDSCVPSVGQYHPNSNGSQNKMEAHRPVEASAESFQHRHISGTLEELDAFCNEGKVKEAVQALQLLESQWHVPVDLPRFLQLMWACGEAKALLEAKTIHDSVLRLLAPLKVSTYNKIIEMYLKCGAINDAFDVFAKMRERNLTTWDTMITWLAKSGLGEDAIDLFTEFKQAGHKPDAKMFIGVFYACTDVGDINEGMLHFESMRKEYGIVPSMQHYTCIVDMLGSNGYLSEALEFVKKMPMEPSVDVWETLMNLCRINGNSELGDHCAEFVEQLDPSRLNKQSKEGLVPVKTSDLAKEKKEKKLASQNILDVRNKVHEYRAGDTSDPDSDILYVMLRGLREHMKEVGYIPQTRFVLHDVDQESKEDALLAHSERLATARALLTSPARSSIRIIKNLRVCVDCHNALKIIAKLVGREIITRDNKRFHHMKDGVCSCNDYW